MIASKTCACGEAMQWRESPTPYGSITKALIPERRGLYLCHHCDEPCAGRRFDGELPALPIDRDQAMTIVAPVAHVWEYDMMPDRWVCVIHEPHSDACPVGEILNERMPEPR